ncbi:CRISPR-associated protein Cas5 [Streptomyces sp. LP05-1]|uniref:CRISPR-associated protein Cas5 n=1 Tax=Streptomyces pyxinae TaxID=2970734 RepID=A0ABT2CPK1_9ACTN|nr:CRISPR-associated protein Cas5 [Streptomyces sp. LP05-1]MCS0639186.1 CRISPR-associated protein Cas5 [Streptomyces sp. LP05-1]
MVSDEEVVAWRVEFYAPVASFRDPLFPGVTRGLPVPPPSTVRGLLAAATGEEAEPVPLGMAAWAEGAGIDAETYHPIAANRSNPSVRGRVRAGKGGMTIRDRPFLVDVRLVLWLPGADGERIAGALRRPRWPLRLGRSQDVAHMLPQRDGERRTVARRTLLRPTGAARVDHALAPADGHSVGAAWVHRMATAVSPDRLTTRWADYLWCDRQTGSQPVEGAYEDEEGQAVWLLTP